MALFVKCTVSFRLQMISLNNYANKIYIQLSLGNRIAIFLGKGANSNCHLFFLWLLFVFVCLPL